MTEQILPIDDGTGGAPVSADVPASPASVVNEISASPKSDTGGKPSPTYELAFQSTQSLPPERVGPVAAFAHDDPKAFALRVVSDALRGMAWRVDPKEGEIRWGLPDLEGAVYGSHAREILRQYVDHELSQVGFPAIHAAVSPFPGNGLRVVIHSGETEFFDSVFDFTRASIA